MPSIAVLQDATESIVWTLNAVAAGIVVIIYFASRYFRSKGVCAALGMVLLLLAGGNVVLLENVQISTAGAPAALFGMLVFAPLGSTFVANWLSHSPGPSRTQEDKKAKQEMILARAKMLQGQSDMDADVINSSAD